MHREPPSFLWVSAPERSPKPSCPQEKAARNLRGLAGPGCGSCGHCVEAAGTESEKLLVAPESHEGTAYTWERQATAEGWKGQPIPLLCI